MSEIIYLVAGIVLGWTLRWERDRKLFKQIDEEIKSLKIQIKHLLK